VPGRVGTVSGIFFGFAFGAGAIGAALLGQLADVTSIDLVYKLCSYLPAIGLLTMFLPDVGVEGTVNAQGPMPNAQVGIGASRK
jgi:FSR family fosmidomycin resistance protein-like MFS transporter